MHSLSKSNALSENRQVLGSFSKVSFKWVMRRLFQSCTAAVKWTFTDDLLICVSPWCNFCCSPCSKNQDPSIRQSEFAVNFHSASFFSSPSRTRKKKKERKNDVHQKWNLTFCFTCNLMNFVLPFGHGPMTGCYLCPGSEIVFSCMIIDSTGLPSVICSVWLKTDSLTAGSKKKVGENPLKSVKVS